MTLFVLGEKHIVVTCCMCQCIAIMQYTSKGRERMRTQMFVTIGAMARSHLGRGWGVVLEACSPGILDSQKALQRHSEAHFWADLDQFC